MRFLITRSSLWLRCNSLSLAKIQSSSGIQLKGGCSKFDVDMFCQTETERAMERQMYKRTLNSATALYQLEEIISICRVRLLRPDATNAPAPYAYDAQKCRYAPTRPLMHLVQQYFPQPQPLVSSFSSSASLPPPPSLKAPPYPQ